MNEKYVRNGRDGKDEGAEGEEGGDVWQALRRAVRMPSRHETHCECSFFLKRFKLKGCDLETYLGWGQEEQGEDHEE